MKIAVLVPSFLLMLVSFEAYAPVQPLPEPSILPLLSIGALAGLAIGLKKRRKR